MVGNHFGVATREHLNIALDEALKQKYDVILLGDIPWKLFPLSVQKSITAMVASGTGVVRIAPDGEAPIDLFMEPKKTLSAPPPLPVRKNFLTGGLNFSALPWSSIKIYNKVTGAIEATAGKQPYLISGKYKAGRVVNFAYKAHVNLGSRITGGGITPAFYNIANKNKGNYWEYYYSMLGRAILWVGNHENPIVIKSINHSRNTLKIELNTPTEKELDCEVTIRNRYGIIIGNVTGKIKGAIGKITPVPITFHGKNTIDVILRNSNGSSVAWGGCSVYHSHDSIKSLKVQPKVCRWNEFITVEATNKPNSSLILEMFDSHGRMLAQQKYETSGSHRWRVQANGCLLSRRYTIKAKQLLKGTVSDIVCRDINIIPAKEQLTWNDFEPGIWLTSAIYDIREHFWPLLAKKLDKMGIKTIISNSRLIETDFSVRFNYHPTFLCDTGFARAKEPVNYTRTGDKHYLVRTPCLSSPKFRSKTIERFSRLKQLCANYTPRWVWLGDELSLTGYSGQPVDFCFSPDCMKSFRTFLKKKYQTLDKLNQTWETKFSSWEVVFPMTRQEVWKRNNGNYSPWADHRAFMDTLPPYIIKNYIQKVLPGIPLSISGTQTARAYGGMNWSKLAPLFGNLMSYFHHDQGEMHRAFIGNQTAITPWTTGYSFNAVECRYNLWESLIYGAKGVMCFHAPSIVEPDYTFSKPGIAAVAEQQKLTQGIGKFFINCMKRTASVGIYYSQPSLRAAFILNRVEPHELIRRKYFRLCEGLGIAADFIVDIAKFQNAGGKLLVLADTLALSDTELDAIRSFVATGGIVISDSGSGKMNENCIVVADHLRERLKNTAFRTVHDHDFNYPAALSVPNDTENAKRIGIIRANFISDLKAAGITDCKTEIFDADTGKPCPEARIFPYCDQYDNRFFVILHPAGIRRVKIHFPYKRYWHEINSQKQFGYSDTITIEIGKERPCFFVGSATPIDKQIEFSVCSSKRSVKFSVKFKRSIDTVAHIRFYDPAGKEYLYYRQNLLLRDGYGEGKISIALNEPSGNWSIVATEVITGKKVKKVFKIH